MKKVFVALFALILSMLAFNAMALGGDGRLNRGFRGFVNVTTNFGIGSHTRDNYQLQSGFTGGYQINQYLFVGGGLDPTLNLNAYHNDDVDAKFVLPLFSAIRFDVLDKQFTPFVEGRLGYYVDTDDSDRSDLYFYAGTGMRLSRVSLSLGYTYYGQGGNYYRAHSGKWEAGSYIGLKFAFEF